jgi:methylenetetrahydrofolate reductase (NADH)
LQSARRRRRPTSADAGIRAPVLEGTGSRDVADVFLSLLERPRYEVIPLAGVEDDVLAHVPRDVKVTVTVSPRLGLGATLELSERLAAHGFEVVPHLSARLVRDEAHLRELLDHIKGMGVRDLFVVAGDAKEPAGRFAGAAPLLAAMAELGHDLAQIGITGYPESHPSISDDETIRAMFAKAPFATYIVSQICFDPRITAAWIDAVWRRGTTLPIHVGLPGAVPRAKLVRISTRIGLGRSARFIRHHRSWFTRLLRPGGFDPGALLAGLEPAVSRPAERLGGLHVFTFNDLADTESWRTRELERRRLALAGAG